MIAIIDYDMGNIGSLFKALNKLNCNVIVSSNADEIDSAKGIILPGVGHFARAMNNLHRLKLIDYLMKKVLIEGTPILGICLGMQLFADYSEEGNCKGLNFLNSEVLRFAPSDKIKYKVPHMGWNSINVRKDSKLFAEIKQASFFYFVHSFYMKCNVNTDILAETTYFNSFVSAIHKGNIFGAQFHPEKSHTAGQIVLTNFVNLCEANV